MNSIDELARMFEGFPGIGPRQAKRFVYHLLSVLPGERLKLGKLVEALAHDVRQCPECFRFSNGSGPICSICGDSSRDDALLMIVEKDQDLSAMERAGSWKGRYFVLGGVLTLSGKGAIREKELLKIVGKRIKNDLKEIVIALSATSEGEHTADRVREILEPFRAKLRITMLGRGLATGSELEYSDRETLSGALANRKEA